MKNILVGNLNSSTTAEAIHFLLAPLGIVRKIKLMTDRDTGLSRGFAFVEMTETEAGRAIAALDGRILDGLTIHLREGRPKLHRGRLAKRGVAQPANPLPTAPKGQVNAV